MSATNLTSAIPTLASSLRCRFIALDNPDRYCEYIFVMAQMHAGTEVDDGALHTALLALERVGAFTRIGYGPDALYAVKPPLPIPAAMQASPQGELQHPFVYNSTLAGTSLHCIRLRCPVCSQANLHVPEAMPASPQGELFASSILSVRAQLGSHVGASSPDAIAVSFPRQGSALQDQLQEAVTGSLQKPPRASEQLLAAQLSTDSRR